LIGISSVFRPGCDFYEAILVKVAYFQMMIRKGIDDPDIGTLQKKCQQKSPAPRARRLPERGTNKKSPSKRRNKHYQGYIVQP
jgi:hypothetical protein